MNQTISPLSLQAEAVVVGGGPAGLMAAEQLARAGVAVHLFDAMPTVGRKFLLAGKGGLNLTHSEPFGAFAERYGPRQRWLQPLLQDFGAAELRAWALELGLARAVALKEGTQRLGMGEVEPSLAGQQELAAHRRHGVEQVHGHARAGQLLGSHQPRGPAPHHDGFGLEG